MGCAAAPGCAGGEGKRDRHATGASVACAVGRWTRLRSFPGLERSREMLTCKFVARSERICALNLRSQTGRYPVGLRHQDDSAQHSSAGQGLECSK